MVRSLRLITLTAAALVLGASFAHVLEMGPKLTLGPEEYRTVQTIYTRFGPVASILEPLAILGALGLAFLTRRRRAFRLTLIGAIALGLALIVWFAVVYPMNLRMTAWEAGVSADWAAVRMRWEWGHAIHFALQLVGFVALLASTLGDTPARLRREAHAHA